MRRRAAKIDSNQPAIVKALRGIGCRVLPMHQLGNGAPDILVSRGKLLRLLEIKDGTLPPSARKLTPLEAEFYAMWHPHVIVVDSIDSAINAMVSA